MNFFKQIGNYYTLFKQGKIGNVEAGVNPNDVIVKHQLDLTGGSALYKRYIANLSQTDAEAPVATILENSLGNIPVWTRTNIGEYNLALTNAFTENKTVVFISNSSAASVTPSWCFWQRTDGSNLYFLSMDASDNNADNILKGGSVEIRVYQ